MDDEEFYRWYGDWAPLDPPGVAALMAGFDRPWWIVGGWALEAFTGVPREHEDVDLSLLACDLEAFRVHLGDEWTPWSNHGGTLRPLHDRSPEPLSVESQVWLRRSAHAPWEVDLPITPDRDGLWTNKRWAEHVVPVADATWVAADGIRYLLPEIALLYKAALDRDKDRGDLDAAWPLLSEAARGWLRDALARRTSRACVAGPFAGLSLGNRTGMTDQTSITVSRTIDAPTKDVFHVLTNPERHAELDGSGFVVSDEKSDRITGTGQVFRMNMTGDHMGGDYQTDNTVTGYDPNHLVAWQTAPADTDPPGWEWVWRLTAEGGDATQVELTYDWAKVTDPAILSKVKLPAGRPGGAGELPRQARGRSVRQLSPGPYAGKAMDAERTVYLDHAATTPMVPAALEAMTAHLLEVGNPSSLHASGRHARRVVEESRETIAQALGCRPGEVVFTSGGTESDNLAVKGIHWARLAGDDRRTRVLSTAVEHHAVLDPLHWMADAAGVEVELLGVDDRGRLDVAATRAAIERDPSSVSLISVMWANNEVGTLQPLEDVVALAAEHGIPVHTDAVQAVGAVPVDFAASGVDALTLTGHKLGGPYGVGALIVRRELGVTPLIHGGGQERDIRSGTIDTPAIAGFAAAVELAVKEQASYAVRVGALRDDLVRRVIEVVPDAHLHGAELDPIGAHRLPGNAHLGFPGCEGDSLLMLLDARGIECSTGSACSAGVPQPSHVLLAMGCDPAEARHSLRFSLGHTSTAADVDAVVEAIVPAVERARAARVR